MNVGIVKGQKEQPSKGYPWHHRAEHGASLDQPLTTLSKHLRRTNHCVQGRKTHTGKIHLLPETKIEMRINRL